MKTLKTIEGKEVNGVEAIRMSAKALNEIAAKATKATPKAEPEAKSIKAPKPAKATKQAKPAKVAKVAKVKAPVHEPFARIQAVGEIMRQFPKAPTEEIINRADILFRERTGKALNPEETKTQYSKAVNFLLGYKAK